MNKSTELCRGEGCNSYYIQNKKYHLCSHCVFKKNHQGKDQSEVYSSRSMNKAQSDYAQKEKVKTLTPNHNFLIEIDEVSRRNQVLQDNVEEHDYKEEERFFKRNSSEAKKKVQKTIRQLSSKQTEIERKYKLVCIDMDYVEEKVCSGCLKYQGGDIKLSHSHIISRKKCKEIGRPELIYERKNLTYHCMDFGENEGCHRKWENPKKRSVLEDYKANITIITELAPELLREYLN